MHKLISCPLLLLLIGYLYPISAHATYQPPVDPPICECSGKILTVTFRYAGDKANPVMVKNWDYQVIFNQTLFPGDEFTIDNDSKPYIWFKICGRNAGDPKLTCDKLEIGDLIGSKKYPNHFEVVTIESEGDTIPCFCGDFLCKLDETCSSCPGDCGECPPVCGDQTCEDGETCENCSEDCGACPPVCGDDQCDYGESCDTCPEDCPKPDTPPDGGVPGCENPRSGGTCPSTEPIPGPTGSNGAGNPPVNLGTGFAGGCNANGYTNTEINQVGTGILLALYLLFLFVSFRFSLKRHKWVFRGILVALIVCTAGLVYAFPTNNFKPAPGSTDFWVTEDARVSQSYAGVLYHYANDPLRLVDLNTGNTLREVINNQHMVHILGAYSFADLLQVGIDVPLVASQDPNNNQEGGIGNVRILTKLSILNLSYLRLGVGLDFGVPSSTVDFVDDEGFTFTPKLLASTSIWRFDIATNLGFELRDGSDILGSSTEAVVVAPKILGSLGARFNLIEQESLDLDIVTDAFASTPFRDTTSRNLSLELLGGAKATFQNGLALRVGAGAGLTGGVGTPDYRILGGISYTWGEKPCQKLVVNNVIKVAQQPPVEVPVPVLVPVPLPVLKGVYFPYNSSKLTLEAQATILDNLETLKWAEKNGLKYRIVLLAGRTDKRGSNRYNKRLSERRANAVKRFMVKQGFDVSRLESDPQGEIKSNQDAKTQLALARDRVVLTIVISD